MMQSRVPDMNEGQGRSGPDVSAEPEEGLLPLEQECKKRSEPG